MDETGAMVVQCDAQPLATRYRFRMLLVGVQNEYQLAASSTESVGVISGVMSGQTLEIIVQAVNGNGVGRGDGSPTNGSRNGHAEVIGARS